MANEIPEEGETIQLEDVDNEVEDTEDGGAIIREKNEEDHATKLAHFSNIVDEVDGQNDGIERHGRFIIDDHI